MPTPNIDTAPEPFVYFLEDVINTDSELDEVAVSLIDPKLYVGKEAELFKTKWFDYRFMHPVKATILYARIYLKAYGHQMSIRYDSKRGHFMRPVKGDAWNIFTLSKTNYQAFWKGRQSADKYGIPYDVYVHSILRWADNRNWTYLPKPTHMYSKDVKEVAIEAWLEEQDIKLKLPEDRLYLAENFKQLPEQTAFQDYLVEKVKHSRSIEFTLCRLLTKDKFLLEASAIEAFGEQMVNRSISLNLYT